MGRCRPGDGVRSPFTFGRRRASHRKVLCHTGAVAAVTMPLRRAAALLTVLLAVVLGASFGPIGSTGSAATSASPQISTSAPPSAPLRAPRTSAAQDTKFFTDVAEADPKLAAYEQKQENVALRALLTDGSAFCALLKHGGDLNDVLVEEATGARGTESQTHLPLSVTTFNTIESVALLALCPSEQKLLPASVRTKIRNLGKSLGKHPG